MAFVVAAPPLGAVAADLPLHSVARFAPAVPNDAPPYDPTIASPGPDDLTWAEVTRLQAASSDVIAAADVSRVGRITNHPGALGTLALTGEGYAVKLA